MILNGNTIKKLIQENKLIENADLKNVHSSSYDVTVGEYIMKFKKSKKAISLNDKEIIEEMYEKININDGYKFKPGECLLISIEEQCNIPANMSASIIGRTSFNRLGLITTIQHLNPGYKGKLNITIMNCSKNTYILMKKMNIAQIVFEKMDEEITEDLVYGSKADCVYQNENGLDGSKVYKDFRGKVVRHFKGNYYYIENICMNSETKEYMIVYKSLYNTQDSNLWVRPAKMFFELIDVNREDNRTRQQHRFELVDYLTIDYNKLVKA